MSTPYKPPEYHTSAVEALYSGFRRARLDFAVYLPDSLLDGLEQTLLARQEIATYQCSREDEGVAMAAGAALVGRRPVVLMEGSGIGLSGLILARCVAQHTGFLIVAGHNSALGERFDYHAATRLVTEPILNALGVPLHVALGTTPLDELIVQLQRTVEGQRIPAALLIPSFVIRD